MPFVKLIRESGAETWFNSDFIFEVRDSLDTGKSLVFLDLEEGDPNVLVMGTADQVAAKLNVGE